MTSKRKPTGQIPSDSILTRIWRDTTSMRSWITSWRIGSAKTKGATKTPKNSTATFEGAAGELERLGCQIVKLNLRERLLVVETSPDADQPVGELLERVLFR